MRSYTLLLAGAVALASAQSSVSGVPEIPTPSGGDPAATSAAAKINACLRDCDSDDLSCQAACVDVPSPNEDQVNENTACAEECDQGDGSPEDTEKFGECLAKCARQHYFSAGEGTPAPTGSSSSDDDEEDSDDASATTTDTETATDSQTETETETQTGSASGSASDDDATESGDADSAESTGDSDSDSDESSDDSDDDSAASGLIAGTAASFFGLVAAFFL